MCLGTDLPKPTRLKRKVKGKAQPSATDDCYDDNDEARDIEDSELDDSIDDTTWSPRKVRIDYQAMSQLKQN